MSNSVKAVSNNNPLLIDQYGSYVGLKRTNETIESFKTRVVRAYKDLYELDNESFFRSLGYISDSKEINIFELSFNDVDLKNCSVKTNYESTIINIEGEETIINYKDTKFLIELYNRISSLPEVNITLLQDDDSWHFLHCKNIKKTTTDKLLLRQFVENYIVELPRENVVDFDFFLNEEFYYLIVDDSLVREEPGLKRGYFSYKDFPVVFTWTPFAVAACNSNEFKNIIKDSYGNITQRGAKVVNKILEKQNTYWGK